MTLCSQANGANNKNDMNHALQRALIILWLFICLPASVLWLCSEPIMVALGEYSIVCVVYVFSYLCTYCIAFSFSCVHAYMMSFC